MRTEKKYTLMIGCREISLNFVKKIDAENSQGEFIWDKALIRIRKGMNDKDKANTMMHEINHAILNNFDITLGDELEEKIVYAFTNGWTSFIIDNPKFFLQLIKLILTRKKKRVKE